MKFSDWLLADEDIKEAHASYLLHPFVREIGEGKLAKEKFKHYLIQDSLYLIEYAKVYAHCFLLAESVEDLQFLHTCIGVVVADEQNMHTLYLKDAGLTMEKAEKYPVSKANRDYLDYMLDFAKGQNIAEIFVSALPCTLTYAYIGKALKASSQLDDNYYQAWIDTYAGEGFEYFKQESCNLIDRLTAHMTIDEFMGLKEIYLKACYHEMEFWNMSYEGGM